MLIQCPHCFRRIRPTSRQTCPSCKTKIARLSGEELARATVVVNRASELPDVCCVCGGLTGRRVKVVAERTDVAPLGAERGRSDRDLVGEILLGLLLGGIGVLLMRLFSSKSTGSPKTKTRLVLKMTQCAFCKKDGKLHPLRVNFSKGEMAFVVNEMFKARFDVLNCRPAR